MLIGELSQKTNISRHTIRFYEKLGLIQLPAKSRRENNYKEYPEDTLKRIAAIQHIKLQGFTLNEARGIITMVSNGTLDARRGRKYILKKIENIEKQIQDLTRIKNNMIAMAEECGSDACEVNKILNGASVTAS